MINRGPSSTVHARRGLLDPQRPLGRFVEKCRAAVGPRLGRLQHYAPRPQRNVQHPLQPNGTDGTHLPSIGIVTPSYQQGRFLGATIKSVLDQGYPRLSYWIQDGASTDESVEVIRSHADRLAGWQSAPDKGQSHAINLGFRDLDCEVMAYLNADDLLLPGALPAVGECFRRNPNIDVIYGDRIIIDEQGSEIGNWRLPRHNDAVLSWADYVPQETLFWRRSAWDRAGGRIDESFRFAMDWDLLLRLRDTGARFHHMPRFLGAFRIHREQKTSAAMITAGEPEMAILRRRALGYDPTRRQIRRATAPYLLAHMATDLSQRLRDILRRGALP